MNEGWEMKKFGELYSFKNGINFDKTQKNGTGIFTIDVLNMYGQGLTVNVDNLYRIDKDVSEEYKLKNGDILIVRSSVKEEGVAWATIFEESIEPITFCGFIIRGRPIEAVNAKYVVYYLRSKKVREELIKKAVRSTITNINQATLSQIEIPIPKIFEQEKIVSIINEAFTAIEQAKENILRNLQNAKDLFQSELNRIFTEKGDGWKDEKLGKLGTITSSKRIYKSEYVAEGIPFYRTKEIKELSNGKPITLELFISKERYNEIKKSFGVPKIGDILLSAVGTIGEILVIENNEEFYFKDGNIIWLKDFNSTNSLYLKYALTAFVENIKKLSIGSAYSALTIEKLNEHVVSIPPLLIQQEIVTQLDTLSYETKQLGSIYQQKLVCLEELKKSILEKAFKGELTKKLSSILA